MRRDPRRHRESGQVLVLVAVSLLALIGSAALILLAGSIVWQKSQLQQLAGSVPALSAMTLSCTGGQVNVAGTIVAQNLITTSGSCAFYAHTRFDAASGTYSDVGNVQVYTDGQGWVGGGGACAAGLNAG